MVGSSARPSAQGGGIFEKIKETAKETFIYGLGGVLNKITGFLLLPLFTRYLSKSDLGTIALLTIAQSVLVIIFRWGLSTAFFRSYFEYNEEDKRQMVVSTTFYFLICSSAIGLSPFFIFPEWLSYLVFNGEGDERLLIVTLAATFLDIINLVPFVIMKAQTRSFRYMITTWLSFMVQLAVTILLIVQFQQRVWGVVIGNLVGTGVTTLLLFPLVWRHLSFRFSWSELKLLLAYGIPFIFTQLSLRVVMVIDRFFLDRYASRAEVGLYALGDTFASLITVLITQPFALVWPYAKLSMMKRENAGEFYSRILTYLVWTSVFVALMIVCLSEDAIKIMAAKPFWPASRVVPVLALFYVLACANKAFNVGITIHRKSYLTPFIVGAAAAVNIGLNFLLIPRYGMMGAAWASVFSYLVFNYLRFYISNRFYQVRYEWGRILKIFACAALLTFIAKMISIDNHIISAIVRGIIGLLFPFALALFGFYDEKEKRKLAEKCRSSLALLSGARKSAKESVEKIQAVNREL